MTPAAPRASLGLREYGDHPYGAGWMTEGEARGFIAEAAERWREIQMIDDDTLIVLADKECELS